MLLRVLLIVNDFIDAGFGNDASLPMDCHGVTSAKLIAYVTRIVDYP